MGDGKFLSLKTNLNSVTKMQIRAIYKNKVLKPIEKLDLEEGEEVEIELRRRKKLKLDILKYAGILKLNKDEEKIFLEAVKRRELFL